MKQEIIKLGKIEIELNELTDFVVKAKKFCYAGGGNEIKLLDGSKLLTFQEGNLYYEDNYDGWYQAPGSELVRWQGPMGQRIWQMGYSGGMESNYFENEELTRETFGFLKQALLGVNAEMPFRGPGIYEDREHGFIYRNNVYRNIVKDGLVGGGDIKRFSGREDIFCQKEKAIVFSQDYTGCLVIPK